MSITPEVLSVTPLFINLGVPELSIIVVLVLILFGPGKLPSVMKSLGDGVRHFKDASNGHQQASVQQAYQTPPQPTALPHTSVTPQSLTAPPSEEHLAEQRKTQNQTTV